MSATGSASDAAQTRLRVGVAASGLASKFNFNLKLKFNLKVHWYSASGKSSSCSMALRVTVRLRLPVALRLPLVVPASLALVAASGNCAAGSSLPVALLVVVTSTRTPNLKLGLIHCQPEWQSFQVQLEVRGDWCSQASDSEATT